MFTNNNVLEEIAQIKLSGNNTTKRIAAMVAFYAERYKIPQGEIQNLEQNLYWLFIMGRESAKSLTTEHLPEVDSKLIDETLGGYNHELILHMIESQPSVNDCLYHLAANYAAKVNVEGAGIISRDITYQGMLMATTVFAKSLEKQIELNNLEAQARL